jgi:heat-inducible transcriptional repressor
MAHYLVACDDLRNAASAGRPMSDWKPSAAGRPPHPLEAMPERAREIFRRIVETYLATGEPVGSRTLSQRLAQSLSPASVRNVMADLEDAGLIAAPHTSAGRIPTETGLRFFVDGMMEVGGVGESEKRELESRLAGSGRSLPEVLTQATALLSGLSHCAGLVLTPKRERTLRHVEFVPAGPGRALVILVGEDGAVENRMIEAPIGLPAGALREATNFLSARLAGKTLSGLAEAARAALAAHRAELDALTADLVERGFAEWSGGEGDRALIVRGQARLLDDVDAAAGLDRIQRLFEDLEREREVIDLLDLAGAADGVSIFIGSENRLFSLSGSSVIAAPYRDGAGGLVGVIGVIGPTRLNYARIVPMVDYTARLVGRLITGQGTG